MSRLDMLPGGSALATGLPGYWYIARPARVGPREAVFVGGRLLDSARDNLVETDGYLWHWLGEGEPQDEPPRLEFFERTSIDFEMRTIPVAADWRLLLENSLDVAHSSFLHAWVSPLWWLHHFRPNTILDAKFRGTARGLVVDARVGTLAVFRHEFQLPDRLRLTLFPESGRPLDVLVHHVPERPGRSRMEVLVGVYRWPPKRSNGGKMPVRWRKGALWLHCQDVSIVEAQQRAWERSESGQEWHCTADAYTIYLRRILAAAAAGLTCPTRENDVRIRI